MVDDEDVDDDDDDDDGADADDVAQYLILFTDCEK